MIYGITVGSGKFADMAICQLRSIHEFTSCSRKSIVANCPEQEWKEIKKSKRELIKEMAVIHNYSPPLPEYPLSAFQATGRACNQYTDHAEYFLLIDTDSIVLNPTNDEFNPAKDLGIKPADFHYEKVGLSESVLREAFDIIGIDFPPISNNSTVDNKPIPPYWNGGVMFVGNSEIIERWIELNKLFFDELDEDFFIEQYHSPYFQRNTM